MRSTIIALSAAALIAATPAVFAQSDSSKTPGQEMYDKGWGNSPGASGHTPGHEMQKGSAKGTKGASGYAPGQTTGSNTRDRDQTRTKR